ncbi:MAG TPA: GntR family transcriptional regulator [Candidatus Obscuribacterales bacterium]
MIEVIPEQIAHSLKKMILKSELQPGQCLDPEALAKKFQASRAVVCEGLRQLQEAGLVVYDGAKPIVADLNEIFDLQLLMEPEALRLAVPNHTEELWLQAEKLLDEIDVAQPDGPWLELNWQFHRLLYSTANRPRLLAMIQCLHGYGDQLAQYSMGIKDDAQIEHRKIMDACKRRDVETACKMLIEHINQRRRELFNRLTKQSYC